MNFRCFNFQKHSQSCPQGHPRFNFCVLGWERGHPWKINQGRPLKFLRPQALALITLFQLHSLATF